MSQIKLDNKIHIPRIYYKKFLEIDILINLDKKKINHYIINVLRMKRGDLIILFNNTNYIYVAKILKIQFKKIIINIIEKKKENNESPIKIHLIQMISKKEKMNFTIEKAVELGVHSITPIISKQTSNFFLNQKIEKKIKYWNNIITSACAQSKRNIIPTLYQPKTLIEWHHSIPKEELKIYFHHRSKNKINIVKKKNKNNIFIIIGSEKGFSENEIKYMQEKSFLSVSLGPRILRTETAAITAIASIQILFGDMS